MRDFLGRLAFVLGVTATLPLFMFTICGLVILADDYDVSYFDCLATGLIATLMVLSLPLYVPVTGIVWLIRGRGLEWYE